MKILIAPDSFKGSATAVEVGNALARGFRRVFSDAEIRVLPMADGGEGTVSALVSATGGEIRSAIVKNPIGYEIIANYGILGDQKTGVIEMSAASGLTLIKPEQRNPLLTTTYGTGQLILSALNDGCRRLIIGIGGSATNDGGAGMAQALGALLKKTDGTSISDGGQGLAELSDIDVRNLDCRLGETEIIVACDVDNPLTGPRGASYVYGPQKGATLEMMEVLDENLARYAEIIKICLGKDIDNLPGAGAAGGLGAGLMAFVNAQLESGIDIVTNTVKLVEQLKGVDLVVTGEGYLDQQTIHGKTPVGVARIAQKQNIPVIAVAGGIQGNPAGLYQQGITSMMDITPAPIPLCQAMNQTILFLEQSSERIARLLKIGGSLFAK